MPRPRKNGAAAGTGFVIGSRVRDFVRSRKLRLATEFKPALDAFVAQTLEKACGRAKANGRSTVRPQDI